MDLAQKSGRKPRVDSERNRERLLAAAKTAFADLGAEAPLEEIARRAEVGIGTLYRHFASRDALIAAVYKREVDQLAEAAETLLAEREAGAALEAWLHQLVDYMATKRVIGPAVQATPGGAGLYASSGAAIVGSLGRLVEAARASGDIHADIAEDDMSRLLAGVCTGYDQPGWAESARRLIKVLMAGLRAG